MRRERAVTRVYSLGWQADSAAGCLDPVGGLEPRSQWKQL